MGQKWIMNDVLDISNSLAPKSRKLYEPGMVKVFIPALKRAIYLLFLIKKKLFFTMTLMIMMTITANFLLKIPWVGCLGKITTALAIIACVVSVVINCNVILLTTQSSPIH